MKKSCKRILDLESPTQSCNIKSIWPKYRKRIKDYDIIAHIKKNTKRIKESEEITSDTNEIKNNLSYKQKKSKKKVFSEMMGYQSSTIHSPLSSNYRISTPKISLTDFMGVKKYNFLKKTGFLLLYDEQRRLDEIKILKNKKNSLSYSNLKHIDIIRENLINLPNKKKPVSAIITINSPTKRNSRKTKSHQIEFILNECELLNKKNSKIANIEKEIQQKTVFRGSITEHIKRDTNRKITKKELNIINLNVNKMG